MTTFGSVCSGIEAASVAWESLGFEPVAFAEFDAFPSAVLAHRFPRVCNLGDVTKITEERIKSLGRIDIVVFGSPCQDLSVAGLRKGFSGERSGLFHVAIRIVQWARKHCGCRFALWENVFGAFSSNQGRDFAAVVEQMAGCRDVAVPPHGWGSEGAAVGDNGLLEWGTLDAQWFGVAQRRRRVFALADFGDWTNRPPILLEPHRLRRDTPPSRGPRQAVAALTANGVGTCGADDNQGQAGHLIPAAGCWWDGGQVSQTLDAVLAKGQTMPEKNRFPAVLQPVCVTGEVTHTLKAEGFDGSEDGTGRGQPIVAFHPTQDPISSTNSTTHSMGCGSSGGQASVAVALPLLEVGKRTGASAADKRAGIGIGDEHDPMFTLQAGAQHGVAVAIALQDVSGREKAQNGCGWNEDGTSYIVDTVATQGVAYAFQPGNLSRGAGSAPSTDVFPTLKADHGRGSSDQDPHVAYAVSLRGREGGATAELGDEVQNCLRASGGGGDKARVLAPVAVRDISQTLTSNYGKQVDSSDTSLGPNVMFPEMAVRRLTATECERLQGFPDGWTDVPYRGKPAADGPRYKAIGNSMAVPVMAWIGSRIAAVINTDRGAA